MPSIRLTQFAGLMPELSAKLKRKDNAQIAHNCLLYDGRLRAMPAYFKYLDLPAEPLSLMRAGSAAVGRVVPDYDLIDAQNYTTSPMPYGTFGIATDNGFYIGAKYGPAGITGNLVPAGIDRPTLTAPATLVVTARAHLTIRPACVSYALTCCRLTTSPNGTAIEESAPVFLGTVGGAFTSGPVGPLWFEGDAVSITANIQPFISGQNFVRLYRTITAIESGEQLVNTFDTDWNLVDQFSFSGTTFNYIDIILTQNLPGDLLLTKYFFSPYYKFIPQHFGTTESGWPYFVTSSEIQFAERFMTHAWPLGNYSQIPIVDQITGHAPFYDTVFLGTVGRPWRAIIATSDDDTVQTNAYPFPEHLPCIQGTMVTAPFGALYTSKSGIVSLTDQRMQVATRDLLNGGDTLYSKCVDEVLQEFKFADITRAAWFNGWYIGYDPSGKIFVYQAPEDLNDVHAFQQLVTMDAPIEGLPGPWALGDYGLQIAFGTSLYYWPIPGWVRPNDKPQKLCYTWKSKKFVFPGGTRFAAAKVVIECDGECCFKLIGDCMHVYERPITDCQPFRLPPNDAIEWEIEITGTATVSEVHVATSMEDLTEVETE